MTETLRNADPSDFRAMLIDAPGQFRVGFALGKPSLFRGHTHR